jgi:hypothetical protein
MRICRSTKNNVLISEHGQWVEIIPPLIPSLIRALQREWLSTVRAKRCVESELAVYDVLARAHRELFTKSRLHPDAN